MNEERYDVQEGLMIDCDILPCAERHDDHGEVIRDWTPSQERTTVNGHPATRVTRTVIYSAWEPVE